ncbi:NAD(P)H-quinone oxidoreductase [Siminovitchia sediminis]|uniref:NAD(P)H-quinone oxidoreductase n=1 Tax=Siminovitchia sediminis TaxID=1274353 RepID=A0ABW4KE04_9BACI
MKAIIADKDTFRLKFEEVNTPVIKDNELLVKVKAAGLNRADLLQKRGKYPPPPGAPDILGLEASGVIEKIGANVKGWKKGDRVCALLPSGGYAEYAAIPAELAIPIPKNLSFEEGAAIPEGFLTAYLNLFDLGNLQSGETVLIHAGASGVGTAAIQLAKEAGARVIITAGSPEKLQLCRSLGADLAINYKKGPFAAQVKESTGEKGVQLILDFIGAPYWKENIDALAMDGKLVLIGTMGGAKIKEVNLLNILFKRLHVLGTTLRSQPIDKKAALTKAFVDFSLKRFRDDRLKPIIDSIWDWNEAEKAHSLMEENKNAGKIILRINH